MEQPKRVHGNPKSPCDPVDFPNSLSVATSVMSGLNFKPRLNHV